MNSVVITALFACIGLTACSSDSGEEELERSAIAERYPEPKMSAFYQECMRSDGVPGWEDLEKEQYYEGPPYFFAIWLPQRTDEVGQASLRVEYNNITQTSPSPSPKTFTRELEPGQSMMFTSDQVFIGKLPRGNLGIGYEYCVKAYPVIDLSDFGSILSTN